MAVRAASTISARDLYEVRVSVLYMRTGADELTSSSSNARANFRVLGGVPAQHPIWGDGVQEESVRDFGYRVPQVAIWLVARETP